MSARSAKSRSQASDTTPSQFVLDDVVTPATNSLSSQPDSVTPLVASGLRLSIHLHTGSGGQWLELNLEDELNLTGVSVDYPVMCTTLNRAYHLREAMVIGMRRLMDEAFRQELISDYPGELLTMWKAPVSEPVGPTLTPWEDDFIPSLTDLDSL